jgi:hypothetical protein
VTENAAPGDTDVEAVMAALNDLKTRGLLASSDFEEMRRILLP